ncbi:MAG: acetyl-CoA C-acetyltransferase [Planctomycetes bacterium]|nr:acetyl-CoA C-acetyltransferase [Planctomycetota bacterium]
MNSAMIISAVRTPIGRFNGSLSTFSAPKLGSLVVAESIKRAGVSPDIVDEVIMGNVVAAGLGQNPARQASHYGGVPDRVPALTINKVCGSGLKAVMLAANSIKAGESQSIIAGGMESMTNAPYVLPSARFGQRLGHAELVDAMVLDGLWDIYNNFHMAITAELVSDKYKVSREMQDFFAAQSHQKAVKAAKEGSFKDEIMSVKIPAPKGKEPITLDKDEGMREDTTAEKLGQLKPAFKENGTVTAGNASQISDGASALLIMSSEKQEKMGLKPMARIIDYAAGGLSPEWVMMAPVEAVKNLLQKTKMKITDFDLIEINEAFSAAAVAVTNELKANPEIVNIHGGAVALGHPIGCSGARILTTLIYALKQRHLKKGLATLCLGGGNAVALAIELI